MSYCILFAGPIGSGKSPIANYLSFKLNLPIFNNDSIRTEVQEDLLTADNDEYEKRRLKRFNQTLDSGISFILDASIDRKWDSYYKVLFCEKGYKYFIISLDLSMDKLIELYKAKGYAPLDHLERTYVDHQSFISKFKNEIGISITDKDFLNRLDICLKATEEFKI